MRVMPLLLVAGIAGCANNQALLQEQQAIARLDQLANAELTLQVDLINQAGIPKNEVNEIETQAFQKIMSDCMPKYMRSAYDLAHPNKNTPQALGADLLPAQENLSSCAGAYGVTAIVGMELGNGEFLPIATYFKEANSASQMQQLAHRTLENERRVSENSAFLFLGAIGSSMSRTYSVPANPSMQYVAPYIRANGGLVNGHFKTMPNYNCYDNLNGCR